VGRLLDGLQGAEAAPSTGHKCGTPASLSPPYLTQLDAWAPIKQFRQAYREVGLSVRERYEASEALHAEKQSSGRQEHMSYEELLAWLREWKDTDGLVDCD
jgi:hypothetical protein